MNIAHLHPRTTKNKYGLLLIALICFIMFSPLMTSSYIGRVVFLVLFVFTILGVSKGISKSSHYRWLLAGMGFVAVIFNLLGANDFHLMLISRLMSLLFFGLTVWQFSLDIFVDCDASIDSLFGSICIYLLIGTMFSTIYVILSMFRPDALVFSANNEHLHNVFDYFYFSFVTLTTTGFGDIVAVNQVARCFVTIESVVGLFYLAILVAHLATLMNPSRRT